MQKFDILNQIISSFEMLQEIKIFFSILRFSYILKISTTKIKILICSRKFLNFHFLKFLNFQEISIFLFNFEKFIFFQISEFSGIRSDTQFYNSDPCRHCCQRNARNIVRIGTV